ncbi:MAG: hypothetical protein ACRD4O_16370 [Bryobacteraceae bacterium]
MPETLSQKSAGQIEVARLPIKLAVRIEEWDEQIQIADHSLTHGNAV